MYKTKKRIIFLGINAAVLFLSVILSILLVGLNSQNVKGLKTVYAGIPAVVFLASLVAGSALRYDADKRLKIDNLEKGYTAYLSKFIEVLRFCYSFDDFYASLMHYARVCQSPSMVSHHIDTLLRIFLSTIS